MTQVHVHDRQFVLQGRTYHLHKAQHIPDGTYEVDVQERRRGRAVLTVKGAAHEPAMVGADITAQTSSVPLVILGVGSLVTAIVGAILLLRRAPAAPAAAGTGSAPGKDPAAPPPAGAGAPAPPSSGPGTPPLQAGQPALPMAPNGTMQSDWQSWYQKGVLAGQAGGPALPGGAPTASELQCYQAGYWDQQHRTVRRVPVAVALVTPPVVVPPVVAPPPVVLPPVVAPPVVAPPSPWKDGTLVGVWPPGTPQNGPVYVLRQSAQGVQQARWIPDPPTAVSTSGNPGWSATVQNLTGAQLAAIPHGGPIPSISGTTPPEPPYPVAGAGQPTAPLATSAPTISGPPSSAALAYFGLSQADFNALSPSNQTVLSAVLKRVYSQGQQLNLTVEMLQGEKNAVEWSLPGTSDSADLFVAALNLPGGPAKMQMMVNLYQSQNADWRAKVAAYFGAAAAQYQSMTGDINIANAALNAAKSIGSAATAVANAAGIAAGTLDFIPIAGQVLSAAMSAIEIIASSFYGPQNPVPWYAAGPGGFGATTQTFSPNRWKVFNGWAGATYWCNGTPTVSWMIPRLSAVAYQKGPVTGGSAAQAVGPNAAPQTTGSPYGPYDGSALLKMAQHWPFGPPVPVVAVFPALSAGYSWGARQDTYVFQPDASKNQWYSVTDPAQIGNVSAATPTANPT